MRIHSAVLLSLCSLTLAGCDFGVTGTGGGEAGPTATQLSEVARSFTDDLESETSSLTMMLPGAPVGIDFAGSCPVASNVDDDDDDGIVDDATLTYAGTNCQDPSWRGGSIAVTGTVRVEDLSQSNDWGYTLTFNDLAWSYVNATASLNYTATRNGTRSRIGDADSIEVETIDTTDRARTVISAVAQIYKELIWSFGADDDDGVTVDQPLPDGLLSVRGNWTWKRSTEDWALSVSTATRLHYDASCAAPQRFTAGTVRLSGTVAGAEGRVELTYTGCGAEPTRTFIRT